jgi:hypothetical protein
MNNELIGKLLGFVMAHSALIGDSLEPGELMVPYVIFEQSGKRKVIDFEADTQELAVENADKKLIELSSKEGVWAYSQDGLITTENGNKQDGFFFKVWTPGMTKALEAYQMYDSTPFKLVGSIQILNFEETGLDIDTTEEFINALTDGISSHPSAGQKWESWRE